MGTRNNQGAGPPAQKSCRRYHFSLLAAFSLLFLGYLLTSVSLLSFVTKGQLTVPAMDQDGAIPSPGNTYIILEKGTKHAITLTHSRIELEAITSWTEQAKSGAGSNRWKCVEKDGFFGFYNTKSGAYLGHNGGDSIYASAQSHRSWELLIPRRHRDGGYELLSPFYWEKMLKVRSVDGGVRLMRSEHGGTLWEFVKA